MQHLLLLHGAIGAAAQLVPLSESLKSHYIVHNLTFSGHGGKPMPEDFAIATFADDVLNYLADNNIASANIFGYSMGGYVALYLAKHHPDKVKKVFTLGTKFRWDADIAQRETKMLDAEKIEAKIPAYAKYLEQLHHPADWKLVLQKTATMMTAMGNDNPLHPGDHKKIQLPVMIGIGDSDAMVTLEETIEVFRNLSDANLIVFPNMQHPIEKAPVEKLRKEIIGFFG